MGPKRVLYGLSAALTAGVIVLTIVVFAAAFLGSSHGFPGPGVQSLAVHSIASIILLILQGYAYRRVRYVSGLASLAIFITVFFLLWTQWWGA
ncbi:MAG: hypothetical protein ACRCSF_02110 [Mycobacteriaceae bacterium]